MKHQAAKPIGSRIRQKRLEVGMRQSHLAKAVGISPSYLNLIEHSRRKIGGKLINDIAGVLETDPELLDEGAEAIVVQQLLSAASASDFGDKGRVQEFAQRFPGWADAFLNQSQRITDLERTTAALSDRLAHNPHLAASFHDLVSTVTAIRSSASILAQTPDIEPHWRDRFQRNIFEDADRLAESAKRVASFLGTKNEAEMHIRSPHEEFESFLLSQNHYFPRLENGNAHVDEIVSSTDALESQSAKSIAIRFLTQYLSDAEMIPEAELLARIDQFGIEPALIANSLGKPISVVMRRLAAIPVDGGAQEIGIASCDASGTLLYSKPTSEFLIPRHGNACSLWPIYTALTRPMAPVEAVLELQGNPLARFKVFAFCELNASAGFGAQATAVSTMLILPDPEAQGPMTTVGPTCAICAKDACPARREPSVLTTGL